ncbi:hypothetical protein ES705_30483 [subsurface metagenome]
MDYEDILDRSPGVDIHLVDPFRTAVLCSVQAKNLIKDQVMMKRFLLIPLVTVLLSALIFGGCARPAAAPAPAPPAGPFTKAVAAEY